MGQKNGRSKEDSEVVKLHDTRTKLVADGLIK